MNRRLKISEGSGLSECAWHGVQAEGLLDSVQAFTRGDKNAPHTIDSATEHLAPQSHHHATGLLISPKFKSYYQIRKRRTISNPAPARLISPSVVGSGIASAEKPSNQKFPWLPAAPSNTKPTLSMLS